MQIFEIHQNTFEKNDNEIMLGLFFFRESITKAASLAY